MIQKLADAQRAYNMGLIDEDEFDDRVIDALGYDDFDAPEEF